MGIFFAIFLGLLAYGNITTKPGVTQVEKKIQINDAKTKDVSPNIAVSKPEPSKLEPIQEEVKSEPTKLEPIQEEAKSEPSKLESIQEEVKSEPTKLEAIQEEVKSEPTKLEAIQEEAKSEPSKLEPIQEKSKSELTNDDTKVVDSKDETGTSWLRLILYILGPILLVAIGKYFYTRLRNETPSNNSNKFLRSEFKEEVQTDNTEQQQPAQEEDEDYKKQ